MTATDQDEGDNGVVLFSITSTDFSIDEITGVITTAASFNYETDREFVIEVTAQGEGQRLWSVTCAHSFTASVCAFTSHISLHMLLSLRMHPSSDNASFPMESRVNVIVNITDVNDLAPSFSPLPPPLTLQEDVAVGRLVASVRATDGDSGTNGEV